MATTAGQHPAIPISFGAEQLTAGALARQRAAGHSALSLNHWLLAVIERPGTAGSSLGDELTALAHRAREQLAGGQAGPPLPRDTVYALARARAAAVGHPVVTTEDVSVAVVSQAGPAAEPVQSRRERPPRPPTAGRATLRARPSPPRRSTSSGAT